MVMWKSVWKSGDLRTTCSNSEKESLPSLTTSDSVMTRAAMASCLSSARRSPAHRKRREKGKITRGIEERIAEYSVAVYTSEGPDGLFDVIFADVVVVVKVVYPEGVGSLEVPGSLLTEHREHVQEILKVESHAISGEHLAQSLLYTWSTGIAAMVG